VLKVLRDLNERLGPTALMITHDPTVASYGHRIVHMPDGRIVDS
jgi:ABC-type lipoprotein export system ATPase subunit